jgi:hypothetical protein
MENHHCVTDADAGPLQPELADLCPSQGAMYTALMTLSTTTPHAGLDLSLSDSPRRRWGAKVPRFPLDVSEVDRPSSFSTLIALDCRSQRSRTTTTNTLGSLRLTFCRRSNRLIGRPPWRPSVSQTLSIRYELQHWHYGHEPSKALVATNIDMLALFGRLTAS